MSIVSMLQEYLLLLFFIKKKSNNLLNIYSKNLYQFFFSFIYLLYKSIKVLVFLF